MTEFHDWDGIRVELDDGDSDALAAERAWTEAWVSAFHLAEEHKRLGLAQRQVADLMGVTPGRVSQIENGDLDVNEVATLSRYAQALGVGDTCGKASSMLIKRLQGGVRVVLSKVRA